MCIGARTHIHGMCVCVKKPTSVSRLLRLRAIRVLVVCVYNKCSKYLIWYIYTHLCVWVLCVCEWVCVCVLVMYWKCFDIRTNKINKNYLSASAVTCRSLHYRVYNRYIIIHQLAIKYLHLQQQHTAFKKTYLYCSYWNRPILP